MQTSIVCPSPANPMAMSIEDKLRYSRSAAEHLVKREIKCPCCGFYLLDVYGRDHFITSVKCRKCKFNEVIDTALFRTVKDRRLRTSTRRFRSMPSR